MRGPKKIVLYTKHCFHCEYPEEWQKLLQIALHENARLTVVRTAYRPLNHNKAAKLWGSEDYPAFIKFGKEILEVKKFLAKHSETKQVLTGKTKEVKDDVPGLSKTTRSNRVDYLPNKIVENSKKTKERA